MSNQEITIRKPVFLTAPTDARYYKEEWKRHQGAYRIKLSKQQAVSASKLLYYEFDVPDLPILFNRKNYSGFRSLLKTIPISIDYSIGMLNLRTVAHEVAHYVDAYNNPNIKKRHGANHRKLVDRAIRIFRKHGLWDLDTRLKLL